MQLRSGRCCFSIEPHQESHSTAALTLSHHILWGFRGPGLYGSSPWKLQGFTEPCQPEKRVRSASKHAPTAAKIRDYTSASPSDLRLASCTSQDVSLSHQPCIESTLPSSRPLHPTRPERIASQRQAWTSRDDASAHDADCYDGRLNCLYVHSMSLLGPGKPFSPQP